MIIKNILLNGEIKDISVQGNKISKIGNNLVGDGEIIDGKGKAAIPGLINGHTHAAMTLFRGFGDDLPLQIWLKEKIWPNEAKLNKEYVYWGSKLACLEMIKSGTTTFNDMYYYFDAIAQASQEMGLRAFLTSVVFDHFDPSTAEKSKGQTEELYQKSKDYSDLIHFTVSPHAIYTVSGKTYQWCAEFAQKYEIFLHTHLAETETEFQNSLKEHGATPVRYLDSLNVLNEYVIAAHCVWLNDEDIAVLGEKNVKVIHNPNSNLKLSSGYKFRYEELKNVGVKVGLGTDGCSSSNNLDMIEAMKIASLLQKAWRFDPTSMPAQDAFTIASQNGGEILGLKTGKIVEGYLADIVLVDLNIPAFIPNHNFVSNLVYAANGGCVDTVICNGNVIMKDKYVDGEEEILFQANRVAKELFGGR